MAEDAPAGRRFQAFPPDAIIKQYFDEQLARSPVYQLSQRDGSWDVIDSMRIPDTIMWDAPALPPPLPAFRVTVNGDPLVPPSLITSQQIVIGARDAVLTYKPALRPPTPLPDPYLYPPPIPVRRPPWPDDPPDLRPRVPTSYERSERASARRAVFRPADTSCCLRCGCSLAGRDAVLVAPPGLPRATVHVGCLEAGDQVEPAPP